MDSTEKIYSLADLRAWTRRERSLAVLGKPIAHSLSPKMHNAALASCVPAENFSARQGRYFRFEIAPEELADALPLFFEKNFLGLNLTIPHKVAALPLLKKISREAEIIGAANTLARDEIAGGWRGENTDGRGFEKAAETLLGHALAGTRIVLLGAGGAARAIAFTSLARNCASLAIANRSRERAEKLAADLRAHFPKAKISLHKEISPGAGKAENALIVNATPLGLKAKDPAPLSAECLRAGMAVFDTTYRAGVPAGETGTTRESALVSAARERGLPATDGRAMLAWQGALAFEIWTGVPAGRVFPVMFSTISEEK